MIDTNKAFSKNFSVVLAIFVILFSVKGVFSSGADFLKISISPRAAGMGFANVALCDDVTSTFWNPAGLVKVKYSEILISHQNWYYKSGYEYIAYADRISAGNIGLYVGYFHLPSFEQIGAFGSSEGSINVYDFLLGACFGRYIKGVAFGAGAKYIKRSLDDISGKAIAFDLGINKEFNFLKYFKSANYNFKIGVVLNNAGTDINFIEGSDKLPTSFKFGIKYVPFSSQFHRVTFACDNNRFFYEGADLNLGLEYTFRGIISLRTGFSAGNGDYNFTVGGGSIVNFGTVELELGVAYFRIRQDAIISTALKIRNKNSKSVFVPSVEENNITAQKKDKLSITVLNFKNMSGDSNFDYLSATIAETISTYMASSGMFEVKDKREFERQFQTHEGYISTTNIAQLGKEFNFDAVITGSYIYSGDLLRINARIIDIESSNIIAASWTDGKKGKGIFIMMDETAKKIIKQLKEYKK